MPTRRKLLYIRAKMILMVPMSLGMFVKKLVTCKEKKSKLLVICTTAIIQVKFNDFSQKCDLHSFEKNEKKTR